MTYGTDGNGQTKLVPTGFYDTTTITPDDVKVELKRRRWASEKKKS